MSQRWKFSVRASTPALLMALLAALGGAARPSSAQTTAPIQYDPVDIRYGARLYANQCTVCHGATGDGIAGVDFKSGRIRRGATDPLLRTVISTGITGTAMPAFKFDASELTMIVAYLRNMRDFDGGSVPLGDKEHGRALFEGAGACATCHRINGKGPRLAPDLSDIGTVRSAAAIQKTLLDPSGSILPVNRSVRAVTRDGKTVTGRRLNEDTYSVQLIDEQERLVSLQKADLKDYTVMMASSMPAYKDKLSDKDLADVVAYLLSLKGTN